MKTDSVDHESGLRIIHSGEIQRPAYLGAHGCCTDWEQSARLACLRRAQ